MNKNIEDMTLDRQLSIMQEYRLTFEDWGLVKLLWYSKHETNARVDYLYRYYTEGAGKGFSRRALNSLMDKGVIKFWQLDNVNSTVDYDLLELNESFKNKVYVDGYLAGEELLDMYPAIMTTDDGQRYNTMCVAKFYNTLDEFYQEYNKQIRYDVSKHNEVMSLLKKGIEGKMILLNVVEFVRSRGWTGFKSTTLSYEEDDSI